MKGNIRPRHTTLVVLAAADGNRRIRPGIEISSNSGRRHEPEPEDARHEAHDPLGHRIDFLARHRTHQPVIATWSTTAGHNATPTRCHVTPACPRTMVAPTL